MERMAKCGLIETAVAPRRHKAFRFQVHPIISIMPAQNETHLPAQVGLRLDQIEASGSETIKVLANTVYRRAPSTKKQDVAMIGAGAGRGAPVGGGKGIGSWTAAGGEQWRRGNGAVRETHGRAAVIPH